MILRHAPKGSHSRWWWAVLAAIVLILVMLGARAAAAENLGPGGGSRLILGDELVGPYRILATSSPNPATTGTVTYVVRVTDPTTGERINDAQIEVELTFAGSAGVVAQSAATHQNAGNDVDYAAHIPLEQEGSWNGVLRVAGRLGASEATFVQTVSAPRSLNTVLLVGIPFLLVLGVFGALYFVRSGGRRAAAAIRSNSKSSQQ